MLVIPVTCHTPGPTWRMGSRFNSRSLRLEVGLKIVSRMSSKVSTPTVSPSSLTTAATCRWPCCMVSSAWATVVHQGT